MSNQAPLVVTIKATTDAVATGSSATFVVGESSLVGTVTAVAYVPVGAVTGANTNSRTLTVNNRGGTAGVTTQVAQLALVSGTNLLADRENAITLSGTAANLNVAQGDVIEFVSSAVGTGIADPGGEIRVTLSRS